MCPNNVTSVKSFQPKLFLRVADGVSRKPPFAPGLPVYDDDDLHEEQNRDARVRQVPVDERVEQQVDGEQRELDDQH